MRKKNYTPSNPCPLLFRRAHGSRSEFIVHVRHHRPEGRRRRKRRRRGGNVGGARATALTTGEKIE